jgi:hypothetical protein
VGYSSDYCHGRYCSTHRVSDSGVCVCVCGGGGGLPYLNNHPLVARIIVCFRSWPRPLVFLASAVRVERGLAVTFNYPPSLISLVGDNLVSNDQGSSPTMNPAIGIGTGEQILLAEILWRCDSILQTLSMCSSDSEAVGDVPGAQLEALAATTTQVSWDAPWVRTAAVMPSPPLAVMPWQ